MRDNIHINNLDKKICRIEFYNDASININLPIMSTKLSNSCFAFSLHKAGSSLLTGLLFDYCHKISLPTINIPSILFDNGLDENKVIVTENLRQFFKYSKHCFIGWRNYMPFLDATDLNSSRNVFLVRDPRDRLISFYFSLLRSHVLPENGELRESIESQRKIVKLRTPDEEAKRRMIPFIIDNLDIYHSKLPPESTRIYRYEDVIFKKYEWLTDMVEFFGFPRDDSIIKMVANSHDIRPVTENPNAHIRQVNPGNYLKHFLPETIEYLNDGLDKVLNCYGYFESIDFGKNIAFALEGVSTARIFNTPLK